MYAVRVRIGGRIRAAFDTHSLDDAADWADGFLRSYGMASRAAGVEPAPFIMEFPRVTIDAEAPTR